MRIDSSEMFCGYPILRIRDLLKRLQDRQYSVGNIQKILNINAQDAKRLLQDLECKVLIEQVGGSDNQLYWLNTESGNQLALATAAKPVKRETATQKVKDLLDRVKQANQNTKYLYRVKKVALFGSYLLNQDKVNDVDVAIELEPKMINPKLRTKQILNRAQEAAENGRKFSSFMDRLMWPENEIILFLKSGSRTLSLHDMDDVISINADTKMIYDINQNPRVSYMGL